MHNIPKIIHQIAPVNKSNWHPLWKKCQKSWLEHFKDFDYILWNDKEEIDSFVLKYYPQFLNLYKNFPVQIMRIDFARLCILHKFGGIYADMDYFVYKNFYNLLSGEVCLVENKTQEYTSAIVENNLMCSVPDSRFILECINYTKSCFIQFRSQFKKYNLKNWRSPENDFIVNNTTGSGMLSSAYTQLNELFKIQLLPTEIFNNRPGSFDESFVGKHVHTSIWGNEYKHHVNDKFVVKQNGSVWTTTEKNVFKDLEPFDVNNFNFYFDYTNGKYLKLNNLDAIKEIVKHDS